SLCSPLSLHDALPILAFVGYKYAQGQGTLRDGGAASNWQDGAAVQAGIPRYSDQAIAATIACCEYLYSRYGRIPATNGPFRTLIDRKSTRLNSSHVKI